MTATIAIAALDDKTRKLFLKLRKGADTTLSIGQMAKVLAQLGGWTFEEIVGLTPFHYPYDGKLVLATISVKGEAAARQVYDRFAARVVDRLPAVPALGESYVRALRPFGEVSRYEGGHFGADCELWVGTPGYRITAPTGELFEIVADRHDLQDNLRDLTELPKIDARAIHKRLRAWDAFRWLKASTGYLAQINAALGMEEHVPAAERTRDNTGTCGCCFQNVKLDREHTRNPGDQAPSRGGDGLPTLALHGYRRPGDGQIRGRCDGGAYAPYELSAEATTIVRDGAKLFLDAKVRDLAAIESPDFAEFVTYNYRREPTVHRRDDRDWDYQFGQLVERAKRELKEAQIEHGILSWLVAHWELRPLPTAGTREPDYWTPAWRATLAALEGA